MVNANDRRANRPTGIGRSCLFSSAALGPELRNGFKNATWLRGVSRGPIPANPGCFGIPTAAVAGLYEQQMNNKTRLTASRHSGETTKPS